MRSPNPGSITPLSAAWLLLVLVGIGGAGSARGAEPPSFQQGPCPFSKDSVAPYQVTCGTVAVIENRSRDDGRRIKLAVAVVHAQDPHPQPDPVVVLDGGPGQSSMALIALRLQKSVRVHAILRSRDIVFWDQRGIGMSEPHLCISYDAAQFRSAMLGLSVAEERRQNLAALAACRTELERTQTDVSQFGTVTSAADLEDVRRALGIERWNLDGGSYGSRLGLVAMRDAPGAVRSAILDGVMPIAPSEYFSQGWRFARVVQLLDARCAEDPDCHARYPDLAPRVYHLLEKLKASPLLVPVKPGPDFPVDHIVVNDRLMALGLFQAFYDTQLIPVLPAVIEQIERRNTATFEAMASGLLGSLSAIRQSLYVAVECHDQMPGTSVAAIDASNAAFPGVAQAFADDASWPSYCEFWNPHQASAEELRPIASSIPTLLLAGGFDPVTPPVFARQVHEALPASTLMELPSASHAGKTFMPCVADLEVQFLGNPAAPPDSRCASAFESTHFITEFKVLPGLTRLFLGLQTGSHRFLIVITALALLLPLLCLLAVGGAALRRRLAHKAGDPRAPTGPRRIIVTASALTLGAFALLAYHVAGALNSNPNVLLVGIPGPATGLVIIALLAAVLAVAALGASWRLGRRSALGWLAGTAAVAYLCTVLAFVHP